MGEAMPAKGMATGSQQTEASMNYVKFAGYTQAMPMTAPDTAATDPEVVEETLVNTPTSSNSANASFCEKRGSTRYGI